MEIKSHSENPVGVLRRIRREQKILATTRWAPIHGYTHYGEVACRFDDWATDPFGNTYDEQLAKAPEVHKFFSEMILPLLQPASEILDVGCGTGLAGAPLIASGHVVDGIDISREMLQKSKELGYRNSSKQNIVHKINLKDKYDALISVGVFGEYVPPVLALQRALPYLKQRAVVAFTTEKTCTPLGEVFDVLLQHKFINPTSLEQAVYEEESNLIPQRYYYVTAMRI